MGRPCHRRPRDGQRHCQDRRRYCGRCHDVDDKRPAACDGAACGPCHERQHVGVCCHAIQRAAAPVARRAFRRTRAWAPCLRGRGHRQACQCGADRGGGPRPLGGKRRRRCAGGQPARPRRPGDPGPHGGAHPRDGRSHARGDRPGSLHLQRLEWKDGLCDSVRGARPRGRGDARGRSVRPVNPCRGQARRRHLRCPDARGRACGL